MTTATLGDTGGRSHRFLHRHTKTETAPPRTRTWSVSLGLVGLGALAVAAWGGLVPYLGPAINFSADGTGSWHWNLAHALIGLIPGAAGVLAGLALLAPKRAAVVRNRLGLTGAGLLAMVAGAWFVVGPLAWPVLYNGTRFFASATPMRTLEYWIGYALGPGVLLAMAGAFALGWAARHDRPLGSRGSADLAEAVAASPPPAPPAAAPVEGADTKVA